MRSAPPSRPGHRAAGGRHARQRWWASSCLFNPAAFGMTEFPQRRFEEPLLAIIPRPALYGNVRAIHAKHVERVGFASLPRRHRSRLHHEGAVAFYLIALRG